MIEKRELMILERAIEYTSLLAEGINPLTNERTQPGDITNQQKIRVYLQYVEQFLRKYRDDQLRPRPAVKNTIPFSITPEQLSKYVYSPEPITATVFCRKLSELTETEGMKQMSSQDVSAWMMEKGYLTEVLYQGKMMKTATDKGRQNGVFSEEVIHPERGNYIRVTYSPAAQKLLISHLNEVIGCNTRQKDKKQNE